MSTRAPDPSTQLNPNDCFTGLNYDPGESSEEEPAKPISQYRRRKNAKERRRKDAAWDAFAGDFFDTVDFSEGDEEMPDVSVDDLVRKLDHEYPRCPDIDALVQAARLHLSTTWLKLGHRKSVHERMKKELKDRAWTCPTCCCTRRISDCRCGQPVDKHFTASVDTCAAFDPALQSEHGSIVCVDCMRATEGWEYIVEYKQLLHSIPDWLIFLRHVLQNVKQKAVLHANLLRWQKDLTKYGKQYAPALQTLLETDAMAISSRDVFCPEKPENKTRMYQQYKFDGKYNDGNWADVWVPALNIFDTAQDWKPAYKALCSISGQLAIATALWIKGTLDFTPDPARRQTLKPGETLVPTDPWTAGYFRYATPYCTWFPALDRLICFWTPLTVRGPGKCLPSLTIGVNELLYNLIKAHVTEQQQLARAARLTGKSGAVTVPSRKYKLKRSKGDRGRDYATGSGVRVDTPNMEDFATMYTAAVQMMTDHHQIPMLGVGATGAFQFVNYVMTTCNRNRAGYASKYRPNESETPVISTCYSNFISFLGILKLYGVPMCPPIYPSKEDMATGETAWRFPPLVQQVVRAVPALESKLSGAMRYIYTGLPLRRVQKIGDLITDDMRQAMRKLDDTGTQIVLPPVADATPAANPDIMRCVLYAKQLNMELGRQAIGLTQRKQAVELKLVTTTQMIIQYQEAIQQAEEAFRCRMEQLRVDHNAMLTTLNTQVNELSHQTDQLGRVDAVLGDRLALVTSCQADIGQSLKHGLDIDALKTVARTYNSSTLRLPTNSSRPTSAGNGGGGGGKPPAPTVTITKDKYDALVQIAAGLKTQVADNI